MKGKGQVWSTDVIIGIVIFISVIALFYSLLSDKGEDKEALLKANAERVLLKLSTDPELKVIEEGNEINITKLGDLTNLDYEELKKKLGVQGDVCLYLEDENGRVVPINGKTGIGSPKLNISGKPCGT